MSRAGTLYVEENSPIHKIDGSIKFLLLLLWTVAVFLFNDLRVFIAFFLLGITLLNIAKIPFKILKPLFLFILAFTITNSLILIAITPKYGAELTKTFTPFISIYGYSLPKETLWFALTLSMKYLAIFPIMMLFIFTTHPSKFASSLNRIGVSYKVAYAINIALRYIPDVKEEFTNIMKAQEARGVSFKKGEASLSTRIKNFKNILFPLVTSSLNRIEIVSIAMELRGFGSKKRRTWYSYQKYNRYDLITLILICIAIIGIIYLRDILSNRFWYPFI